MKGMRAGRRPKRRSGGEQPGEFLTAAVARAPTGCVGPFTLSPARADTAAVGRREQVAPPMGEHNRSLEFPRKCYVLEVAGRRENNVARDSCSDLI